MTGDKQPPKGKQGVYGNDATRKLLWDNLWAALKTGMPDECNIPSQAVALYFVGETKADWLAEAIAQANGYDEKECNKRVYTALRAFIDGSRKDIKALKVGEFYNPKDLRSK